MSESDTIDPYGHIPSGRMVHLGDTDDSPTSAEIQHFLDCWSCSSELYCLLTWDAEPSNQNS